MDRYHAEAVEKLRIAENRLFKLDEEKVDVVGLVDAICESLCKREREVSYELFRPLQGLWMEKLIRHFLAHPKRPDNKTVKGCKKLLLSTEQLSRARESALREFKKLTPWVDGRISKN